MSVWSDMGVIDGKMRGVNPCRFLNAAYRFFQDLKYEMRHSVKTDHHASEWHDFSFDRLLRYEMHGRSDLPSHIWLNFSTKSNDGYAFNTPITEEQWNSEAPDWNTVFSMSEKDLLGEEPISYPALSALFGGAYISDIPWLEQRCKLIQKVRFVTVPLKIRVLNTPYSTSEGEWIDWGYNKGCIDWEDFQWFYYRQIEADIPEYWCKEGTVCKIGVNSEYLTPYYTSPPFDGDFWVSGPHFKSGKTDYKERYSKIKLYGAVDLATHPDFKKYFDINTNEDKKEE